MIKEEFKRLLKPVIVKHYPILENSPEKIENAADRIYDMFEDLRVNGPTIFDEKTELNKAEYHQETISGCIEYDVIFDRISDIMFDQFKPLPTITVEHSDGTIKEYPDFDDAVIDANYELASILELVLSNSAESMFDALELNRLWRPYVIEQYKIEREKVLDAHVCNGCEHWRRNNCICFKPEGTKCIRNYEFPLPSPAVNNAKESTVHKYVEADEYIRRADECISKLVVASNNPGAEISIIVKNQNGAHLAGDCYCTFYDHAALVQALITALEDFKYEMQ